MDVDRPEEDLVKPRLRYRHHATDRARENTSVRPERSGRQGCDTHGRPVSLKQRCKFRQSRPRLAVTVEVLPAARETSARRGGERRRDS